MRILVTGSDGFIGRQLVKFLKETQNYVYEVSRSRGYDMTIIDWEKSLPQNIDIVIHLAQSKKYRDFPDEANDVYMVNIDATFRLLDWAKKTGVKKFIYTSSGSVYGNQKAFPSKEGDVCNPQDFYGTSKLIAEELIKKYKPFFKVEILRLYTVFGPNQKEMLISRIIRSVKQGDIITLKGEHGIWFSSIYIKDCVNIIAHFVFNDSKEDAINVSNGEFISLKDAIYIISKELDLTPNVQYTEGEPNQSRCENSTLKKLVPKYKFMRFYDAVIQTIKDTDE